MGWLVYVIWAPSAGEMGAGVVADTVLGVLTPSDEVPDVDVPDVDDPAVFVEDGLVGLLLLLQAVNAVAANAVAATRRAMVLQRTSDVVDSLDLLMGTPTVADNQRRHK